MKQEERAILRLALFIASLVVLTVIVMLL